MINGNHKRCLVALPSDLITAPKGAIVKHIKSVHTFLNLNKKASAVHIVFDEKQVDVDPVFRRYYWMYRDKSLKATGLARKCGCVLIYDLAEDDKYVKEMIHYCKVHDKPYIIVDNKSLYKPIKYHENMVRTEIKNSVRSHTLPTKGETVIDEHLR